MIVLLLQEVPLLPLEVQVLRPHPLPQGVQVPHPLLPLRLLSEQHVSQSNTRSLVFIIIIIIR